MVSMYLSFGLTPSSPMPSAVLVIWLSSLHLMCPIPAQSLLPQVSFYYDVPDMIVLNDSHCLLVESNAVVKIEGVPGKTGRPRGGGKKRFLLPTPNVRQTRARTRKNADLVTVIPDADVVTVTPGADLVTVTSGADLVTVIPGADLVTVTPDADVVTVTPGADLVTVTPGADLVTVTPDADVVTVTPDADVVTVTPGADLVTVIPGAAPEVFTTLLPEGSVCLGTFTLPLVLSSADVQQVPMETDVALSGDM